MKVSELQDVLLDRWVARAEGHVVESRFRAEANAKVHVIVSGIQTRGIPHYSGDWAQGGPIIEREGFGIVKFYEPVDGPIPEGGEWAALLRDDSMRTDGPTPLIAGMRLYVMSVFGEEVSEE